MDKRMKATLAVALALAFVLAFAVANTDTETDASGENITVVIHESQTYHDGDTFELNADYQLEPGVVLTFEAGSILTIDALTPWSIEGKEGSGFFFKEGSKVLLTALIFSKENVIEEDTSIEMKGKVAYVFTAVESKFNVSLTISNNTVAVVNGFTYTFTETSVSIAPEIKMDSGALSEVKADIKMKSDGITLSAGGLALGSVDKIDINLNAQYMAPKGSSDKITVALKGDADVKAKLMGITVETSDKIDLTAGVEGITGDIDWTDPSTLKDVIPFISGKMSGDLKINADLGMLKIENAVAQYSADFSEKEVKLSNGLDVDSIMLKYGGVEGYINTITTSNELTVELGSFMELLSGRNILGTIIFLKSYDFDMGARELRAFFTDFLIPIVPPGMDASVIADYLVSQIPEDQIYVTAMPIAYALYFIEEVDGESFGQMCIDTYNGITEEGYASKYLAYMGALAGKMMLSVAGTDDIQDIDIKGSSTFAVGTITADSDKGYSFSSDGFAYTATIDDGLEIEGSINAIRVTADSDKIVAEMATPAVTAKYSANKDGFTAECSVEGDLKFSLQDKSNSTESISLSYLYSGIDITEKLEADKKVAKLSSNANVKSIEITAGDYVISTGSMNESDYLELDSGSIYDLFSLRNLDYLAEFFTAYYDESDNKFAYELVLDDILISAFPSTETEAIIDAIVENTPEEALTYIGMSCQYILFTFGKENLNLKDECEKISATIKDISTVEGFTEYMSKVSDKIVEVVTGIEGFNAPSYVMNSSANIGKITVKYSGEELVFNGASYDITYKDDMMSAEYEFKGLSGAYSDDDFEAEFVLPTIYVEISAGTEIYAEYTVNGDFVFKYIDPQDKNNSYVISVEDISSSDTVRFKDDGTAEVKLVASVGEVYVSYDMKEDDEFAFFMMDGAKVNISGNVDITSFIEAMISQDYNDIIADIEIKESIVGVMYDQMLDDGSRFGNYKAAIDGMDVEMKISNGEKGLTLSGSASITDGYRSTERRLIGIEDATCNFTFADGKGTLEYTGDYQRMKFGDGMSYPKGEAYNMYSADNIVLKAGLVLGTERFEIDDITEASANVKVWEQGITTDFGKVVLNGDYSKGEYQIVSDKVQISGNFTGDADLKSMSGYIDGVTIIPANDSTVAIKFKDSEIEYTTKNGNKLKTTMVPDDATKLYNITFVSSGDANSFMYDPTMAIPNSVIYKIIDSEYYAPYTDKYTVSGDVPVIMDKVDCTTEDFHGKVYFTDGYFTMKDGTVVDVDFHGAMLCANFGLIGGPAFSISALPGYELDPSTYFGFTVDANNNVTIDFSAGDAYCSTSSVGKQYTLTINGAKNSVRYGDVFMQSYTGGDEPLWYVDGDGKIHGQVTNGVFSYVYDVVGDLTLTPVFGNKATTGAPGTTVKVNADAFFVQPANEPFAVENKAGVRFVIDGTSASPYYKFSATETKYDGNKAYDIDGNTGTHILAPISSIDAFVYHVVNDTAVPVATEIYYDAEVDQYYAAFYADSYSVYFIEEMDHDGGKSDNTLLYTIIIVLIIVVIAVVALKGHKKQNA